MWWTKIEAARGAKRSQAVEMNKVTGYVKFCQAQGIQTLRSQQ